MPTQRQTRVARRLMEEIARILQREVDDPLLRRVTITDAEVAPDLKSARVFFSVLATEATDPEQALRALRRARNFIQHQIADEAELRYTPALDFRHDPTAERAQRVEAILQKLADEGALRRDEEDGEAEPDAEHADDEADADFTD